MSDLKMPEVNNVIIAGNLTKDPVYRQTSNNTPVVNFSIASNRKYRDGSNSWQEDVCYVGVVAWNRLAESCRERLKKGSAVLVDGELQSRIWKTEEGYNRSVVEIKARRIQFLNRRVQFDQGENGQMIEEAEDIPDVFAEDDHHAPIDFTEDTFDKFLSNEESDLLK
jgi:single-strand DNA-binding protein